MNPTDRFLGPKYLKNSFLRVKIGPQLTSVCLARLKKTGCKYLDSNPGRQNILISSQQTYPLSHLHIGALKDLVINGYLVNVLFVHYDV